MKDLIENIDKLHTTEMGAERVKRNLRLETGDVVQWCRRRILDGGAEIERAGKNWYVTVDGCRITVNAHSCTIITAHPVKSALRPPPAAPESPLCGGQCAETGGTPAFGKPDDTV